MLYFRTPRPCLLALALVLLLAAPAWAGLPEGFCHVDEAVPGVVLDVRYFTSHNFVGEPVDGYEAPRVILTVQAARALAGVQATLARFGLGLKVFDGYRPQRAVDHFVRWAENLDDYIAAKSGHSRGSTVDLTIIDAATGKPLDMGTAFDFFGPPSWPDSPAMAAQVRANRALLQGIMISHGFRPLAEEWWHFTLEDEPFPDTYFDFPVR